MKEKTLKDLEIVGHDVVRKEAIKFLINALKKRKNMVKVFMDFHNIIDEDLK